MNIWKASLLFIWLLKVSSLYASAPLEPITHRSGKDLTLNLTKDHGISALAWEGQVWHHLQKDQKKLQIERQGFGHLPTQLILIPKNSKHKPKRLKIASKIETLELSPEWNSIGEDELILWGETPTSVCPDHTPDKEMKSHVSLVLSRPRQTKSFSGAFWLELNVQTSAHWLHLYNSHGSFSKVQSTAFENAQVAHKALCHAYYGGECDQVFTLKSSQLGQHQEVKFSDLIKNQVGCPI